MVTRLVNKLVFPPCCMVLSPNKVPSSTLISLGKTCGLMKNHRGIWTSSSFYQHKTEGTMEALGKAHVPYGDEGEGTYTLSTKGCFGVIEKATQDILSSVDSLLLLTSGEGECRPIMICDFGTADGGTSMKLLDEVITKFRQHTNRDIVVQYEDQPNNDFKSLFFHVQGMNKVTDIQGKVVTPYLSKHSNVFVTCSGTSFYNQCYPSNSVHLGFSFTAMHWLSKLPCHLPHSVHHTQIDSESPEGIAFRAQAEQDWERILIQRGKELGDGGTFVLVNFCISEDGYYLGNTDSCKHDMFSVFDQIWKSMLLDGKITEDEYGMTTMCNYYRSKEEVTKPFKDPKSKVSKTGLRLVSLRSEVTRCPYHVYWTSPSCTLSARDYAKLYVGTLRCWSNSTFLSALGKERSVTEKQDIVDELFNRYVERVAVEPEAYAMDYVHHYMVIEKELLEQ